MALLVAALAGASGVLGGGGGDGGDGAGASGEATVTRVVDGDTVVLSGIGKSRLIGVDTPVLWSQHVIRAAVSWEQRR